MGLVPPTPGFTLRYEDEAEGVVASVFRDVRARMDFVAGVCAVAELQALRFPEVAFFGAESARAVLDQFRRALPRNLVFALAASKGSPPSRNIGPETP
jgi:hypothetical protein